jgi:hypothetical protein
MSFYDARAGEASGERCRQITMAGRGNVVITESPAFAGDDTKQ